MNLTTTNPAHCHAIDFSCGNGTRLAQLAQAIGIPKCNTHGIAKDGRDVELARQCLGHVLRADPGTVRVEAGSFSLALAEASSLVQIEAATYALATGGVLILYDA